LASQVTAALSLFFNSRFSSRRPEESRNQEIKKSRNQEIKKSILDFPLEDLKVVA